MKRYDETRAITRQPPASTATQTTYSTPLTDEAAPVVGMAFVAAFVSIAVVFVGNVGSLALHAWTSEIFRATVLAGLMPWVLLIIGYAQELLVFAWPRLERITGRDLDGSGAIGDPHNTVLTPDMRFFFEQICLPGGRGFTQRAWNGIRMPSEVICYSEYHTELIRPLVEVGAIIGRREGVAGKLVINDPKEIMRLIAANN